MRWAGWRVSGWRGATAPTPRASPPGPFAARRSMAPRSPPTAWRWTGWATPAPPTQIWLMRRDLLARRFAGAFAHADALLRREPTPPPGVFAILTAAALEPGAVGPLAERLAANPSWRSDFFDFLAGEARPPPTTVTAALLTRLAAGPTPPTDAEVAPYLRLLVSQQRFADAAAAWRRLTPGAPSTATGVYDGDFERPPGSTPFDWSLGGGVGWTASIAASPDGPRGQALNVEYDGVSPPQPLRQLLVLSPGAYRLSGRFDDRRGIVQLDAHLLRRRPAPGDRAVAARPGRRLAPVQRHRGCPASRLPGAMAGAEERAGERADRRLGLVRRPGHRRVTNRLADCRKFA
jgi:hypothetical protein